MTAFAALVSACGERPRRDAGNVGTVHRRPRSARGWKVYGVAVLQVTADHRLLHAARQDCAAVFVSVVDTVISYKSHIEDQSGAGRGVVSVAVSPAAATTVTKAAADAVDPASSATATSAGTSAAAIWTPPW